MPRTLLVALLFLSLAATPTAARKVYRCADGVAAPVYQDRPCMPGSATRELAEDASLSVVPFTLPAPTPVMKPPRATRAPARTEKRRSPLDRPRNEVEVGERRHLKDGMTDAEVYARLGAPDFQAGKTGRKMRWTYLPAPGDAQTVTMVRFEDGKVVGVERSIMR